MNAGASSIAASPVRFEPQPVPRAPGTQSRQRRGNLDVWAALAVALLAAAAALALPAGSRLRLVATVPMLLLVPGYLLIEAARGSRLHRARDAVAAVGLSPPVLCLAALATALVPAGFRAAPIVLTVTAVCMGLAWLAIRRRRTLRMVESVPVPLTRATPGGKASRRPARPGRVRASGNARPASIADAQADRTGRGGKDVPAGPSRMQPLGRAR